MFCKSNSPIPDELILIKLYTVALYGLGICMKEDNPGLKISRKIIICVVWVIFL